MKLLEIKNNLVKLSYGEGENPVLGRFIILAADGKSYVAQFVNLKSDTVNNFAIAKLLFTFTPDGVVDNYDGSIPSINSELSFLPSEELLNLLPVETSIKIGELSQQDSLLNMDISVFERNFTVFAEKDVNKMTFISNCIRQLFQMKEKSVVIDTANMFEDYPKIEFTKDFKLPLNSKMIDYIFEYELDEVDAPTKAVIQDIFYAVQQYIKTLDFEFLPIDNFVDVVANQYKEIQMPELALLKNKLLKYRDANVFANTMDEVLALKEKLNEKNCSIIDLKDINESLQKEVIAFIHSTLASFDKYVYLFACLSDDNSDKKLLKQLINHNHVFTTMIVSSSYKYATELKQYAQNMILFAPQSLNHDFTAYNTFLNKLNPDECVVYGKLTQGIPFIVDMADLDLDLTREDVLGDRYQFVPANSENLQLVRIEDDGQMIPVQTSDQAVVSESEYLANDEDMVDTYNEAPEAVSEPVSELITPIPQIEQAPIEVVEEVQASVGEQISPVVREVLPPAADIVEPVAEPVDAIVAPEPVISEPASVVVEPVLAEESIIEPVDNILEDVSIDEDILEEPMLEEDLEIDNLSMENDSISDFSSISSAEDNFAQASELTEDDLNFIEDNQMAQPEDFLGDETMSDVDLDNAFGNDQPPVVPVYPADDDSTFDNSVGDFKQGDGVTHPRYGRGVIEKIIKYGNKTLCSIAFENVGRRLLDPTISELTKI